jgi:hypothetical protein
MGVHPTPSSNWLKGAGHMRRSMKLLVTALLTCGAAVGSTAIASAGPVASGAALKPAAATGGIENYKTSFGPSTHGWCDGNGGFALCDGASGDSGTFARISSGSSTNAYGPGVAAVHGGLWYATVDGATEGTSACSTYPAADESCDGPYSDWGNPNFNYDHFPKKGFTTSLDIYLDTSWGAANPGVEFEWDTALNQSSGAFGQDFIFTAQTGASGFSIGVGNNTRSSVPTPSSTIDTSGWYRFIHTFAVNPSTGDVEATMSIIDDATDTQVPGASWLVPVMFNGNAETASSVGGPVYGWFPNENIPGLPIDNSILRKG